MLPNTTCKDPISVLTNRPIRTLVSETYLTTYKSLRCFAVFTPLHAMHTRSSDEKAVCLSVCLSDKRVECDKMEEISVQIFTPYEKSFRLVFREEEWLVGATPST